MTYDPHQNDINLSDITCRFKDKAHNPPKQNNCTIKM